MVTTISSEQAFPSVSWEAIFCTFAIADGEAPPTINYETPDPELDLDYVPNKARKMNIEVALSNSLGFGGHNVCLTFEKY